MKIVGNLLAALALLSMALIVWLAAIVLTATPQGPLKDPDRYILYVSGAIFFTLLCGVVYFIVRMFRR